MHRVTLALAASLALTASGCMPPSAKNSSAEGAAPAAAARGEGERSESGGKKKLPWWRLSQYSREPKEKPWIYGDIRPGKGLLSNGEDGYTLYRQGEAGSSDPDKPSKVRR